MKFDDPFRRPFGAPRPNDVPVIPDFERSLLVGLDRIDSLHREFVEQVQALVEADDPSFATLFDRLLAHTRGHFEFENRRMEETSFAKRTTHRNEHQRVLQELEDVQQAIARGELAEARAYVRERLPGWFRFHVNNMDCALASHLGKRRKG